ncbi:MAG: autotransporter-associated beta strand repeat-containing protein, partial [Verrucomicrobia bacterium]|nr:autotransporter-associated beta strand repeat-containing protein [Verrucomicrobiota bacterium]
MKKTNIINRIRGAGKLFGLGLAAVVMAAGIGVASAGSVEIRGTGSGSLQGNGTTKINIIAPANNGVVNTAEWGTAPVNVGNPAANSGYNNLGGEHWGRVFDHDTGSKVCCNFDPTITSITVTSSTSVYSLTGYTVTTGNDSPGRRPTGWRLYGSNDGFATAGDELDSVIAANINGGSGWTGDQQVGEVTLAAPTAAYASFRFIFDTSVNTAGNEFQLGEIELFGTVGAPTPQAKIITFGPGAVIGPVVGNSATIAWGVPNGSEVTTLGPAFTTSSGATCYDGNPDTVGSLITTGAVRDFTAPVEYWVRSADDGLNPVITNVYTVTVTVNPAETALIWNSAGGGSWDLSSLNWRGQSSGQTMQFFDGANVIFNNSAGGAISVSSGVAPASTTVSASGGTYQFTSGSIDGSGSLTKSGNGWLRLSAASSFTGQTIHTGGTLWVNAAPSNSGLPGPLGASADANAIIDLSPGTTLVYDVSGSTNRPINLVGAGGTTMLSVHGNGGNFTFNGPITANGTGAKTFVLFMGTNQGFYGSGDGQTATINGAISDVSAGTPETTDDSPLGLEIRLHSQSGGNNNVNLNGDSTFTGPIALVSSDFGFGEAPRVATVTIGGTGRLNSGDYPGAISMTTKAGGFSTILNYASSMPQTLSGAISGAGALTMSGSNTLTLSGVNTYTGNTTVSAGTLALGQTGGLTFYVTNTSTNKVTGSGTANFDGSFNIDTSAVTAPIASWTLVDVTNKSYDSNFNVPGFNNSGGVWTKEVGYATWTFTEATGVLSVNTLATITSFGIPGHAGVIDNIGLTISLAVPYATDLGTLAPTFTITSGACDQTSGSPPSPTFAAQNPVTYTVSDGAASSPYVVTVTVAPAPPAGLGESAGLVAWYDASQLTGLSNGNSVDTWADLSGYGHIATRTSGTMTYATNQVNGLPTVQFRSQGYANIFGTMFAKEQYMVFKSPSGNSYNGDWGAVMGDVTDQYGYMMGNGTRFWEGNNPEAVSQNGAVLPSPWSISNMGTFLVLKIDGTYPNTTPRSYSLGNVYGNGSPQYHNVNLDVAEVIAYDHVLSTGEAEQLGSYLTIKYGLSTNYAGLGDIVTFGIPGYPGTINRADKTIALTVPYTPWGTTGLSTLNPTFTLSSGTCDQTSGSPPSPYIFGGPNPVTYTVTDGAIVNTYTVTVTVQPPPPGGVGNGLALWLDASASDTMTLSDATVTEWRDKMLSGAKMTTKGGAPTLTPSG